MSGVLGVDVNGLKLPEIFAAEEPIGLVQQWLEEAEEHELNDPNAIALASVDRDGRPNCRIVLLKGINAQGFIIYTNYESAKAQELDQSQQAAFALHWKTIRRQIRVRGRVERVGGEEADRYFQSRSPRSRLGAWASEQSRPLLSRETLMERVEEARARFGDDPPRPPNWGGYLIKPFEIEFWADGENRLHDRFLWTRSENGSWKVERLNP